MMTNCFLCLSDINDGRPTITVGIGFVVHQECYEDEDD